VKSSVLDIQPIESKDIDVYTCIARNALSVKNSSIAFDNDLNVRRLHDTSSSRAPEIIDIYRYGEQKFNHEYALKCIADMENAVVEWYLNGARIKSGVELTFEYLTSEHEGVYECEAHNSFGKSQRRKSVEIDLESSVAGLLDVSQATPHQHHLPAHDQNEISEHEGDEHLSQQPRRNQHHINIQVLSNPQTDHVENGRVKIKCISGNNADFIIISS
jgi:hypothetical protein